jgi:hypothetical protein
MKSFMSKTARWALLFAIVLLNIGLFAQEADNEFSIDAKLNTRGEIRVGGYDENNLDNNDLIARFIMGQYRINIGYKRSDWLEVKLSPQFSGVWGQAGGTLSLAEGWLSMKHNKTGLFTKIGRQCFEYDDERILGYDDWSMTAPTHDALKLGYEGHGHKVHVLLAYNQNAENVSTGLNYYSDGIQPYKIMQTLWYHYDTPNSLFGISLIGMNIGMESKNSFYPNKTFFQQLFGTYMTLNPSIVNLEGSFYYQMGQEEHGVNLNAFMGSIKAKVTPSEIYNLYTGYDYLSGDDFPVTTNGGFGLIYRKEARGFSPLFGSHHQFYGAMDFFYVSTYVNNFSPGLQNLYVGGNVNPFTGFKINAAYHFYAISSNLKLYNQLLNKALGHEIELNVGYTFAKFITVSAGYSYMRGTETMELLQHVSENRRLHWGWLMLTVTPTFFTTSWNDKKKQQ